MRPTRRIPACLGLLAVTLTLHAGAPPADADLLEFLGSLDSEGDDWSEYLARTPVRPAAPPKAEAIKGDPASTDPDPKSNTGASPPPPQAKPKEPG